MVDMKGKTRQLVTEQLEAFCDYFQRLYTAEIVDESLTEEFLKEVDSPRLTGEQIQKLDYPIELNEIANAIKSVKSNPAPGPDDCTV